MFYVLTFGNHRMSMHLHHASLSINGKRKGKVKFRNAEQARQHREQETEWQQLKKKWGAVDEQKRSTRGLTANTYTPPKMEFRGSEMLSKPSFHTGVGLATKKESPVYTGTKVKGIGTMHKSNAVPIFSDEEAVEISQMRRN